MTSQPYYVAPEVYLEDRDIIPVVVDKWLQEAKDVSPRAEEAYRRQLGMLMLEPTCLKRIKLEASEHLRFTNKSVEDFRKQKGQDAA